MSSGECLLIIQTGDSNDDFQGAGDSFCGSLAYLLVARPNLPIEEQVRRASLIASVSVQRKGTQVSFPWAHELPEDFLN